MKREDLTAFRWKVKVKVVFCSPPKAIFSSSIHLNQLLFLFASWFHEKIFDEKTTIMARTAGNI
jgi:hypothetical protein